MGYFSTGTEAQAYEADFCDRCSNREVNGGCIIWMMHLMENYDECNNPDSHLHMLIPRRKDGAGNEQCAMFNPAPEGRMLTIDDATEQLVAQDEEIIRLRAQLVAAENTIVRLARELAEARAGWQPIETAPKDGTVIWACLNYHDDFGAEQRAIRWSRRWDGDEFTWAWAWCSNRNSERCREDIPTHWMPLPTPPALDAE